MSASGNRKIAAAVYLLAWRTQLLSVRAVKISLRALALALALAAALAFAPNASAKPLTVTGDSDCSPYSYLAPNGEPSGLEVELLREIAARKGFELEFQLKPWNQALRDLCLKKADILLGAVMTPSFSGILDYTIPHSYDQYALFAKSSFKFRNIGELSVYDAAIQKADPVYDILLAPSGAVRNKIWTDSAGASFKELSSGRCVYLVAPYEAGMSAIERLKLSGIAPIGEPLSPCVRRFAVRKGSPELLAFLNEGIDAAKASPSYEKLREKWLKHERKTMDRNTAIRYGLYIVIPLVLALDGLLIWSLLLKRQVRRKSRDLQESRGNYKMLFDGVSDAILVSDAKGRIIEFNAAAAALLSKDGASLAGRSLQEFFGEAIAKLQDAPGKRLETSLKSPDGAEVFLELSSGDSFLGRRKFSVLIARDISERKLAESLKADVERMTRHDLKGPLNGIIAAPEIIRESGPLNDVQKDLLKLIEESGWTMFNMINLAQDMFKLERGVYDLRPAPVNLSPLIRRLLVETHQLANLKKVSVEALLDGKPWQEINPIRISGEETLCHCMLSNLLKNALEASPEGAAVQISITRGDEIQTIAIKNRGAVPRELREKFFEKYATSGKKGGTGLGTYNAMLIAKVHGGDIKMESSEQDGTTVTVTLPTAKEL